jgi:hypothetical protein
MADQQSVQQADVAAILQAGAASASIDAEPGSGTDQVKAVNAADSTYAIVLLYAAISRRGKWADALDFVNQYEGTVKYLPARSEPVPATERQVGIPGPNALPGIRLDFSINKPIYYIGKDENQCDIVVNNPKVSTIHAMIKMENKGKIRIQAVEGTNSATMVTKGYELIDYGFPDCIISDPTLPRHNGPATLHLTGDIAFDIVVSHRVPNQDEPISFYDIPDTSETEAEINFTNEALLQRFPDKYRIQTFIAPDTAQFWSYMHHCELWLPRGITVESLFYTTDACLKTSAISMIQCLNVFTCYVDIPCEELGLLKRIKVRMVPMTCVGPNTLLIKASELTEIDDFVDALTQLALSD